MVPNRKINLIIQRLYLHCSDQELARIVNNYFDMGNLVTPSGVRKRRHRMGLKKPEYSQRHMVTPKQCSEALTILQAALFEVFINSGINWFFGEEHFDRFLASDTGKKLLTDVTIRLGEGVLYDYLKIDEGSEVKSEVGERERYFRHVNDRRGREAILHDVRSKP